MKVCGTCASFLGKYNAKHNQVFKGTCMLAHAQVLATMYACSFHTERGEKMTTKSNDNKRNVYKDKDGVLMLGVTLPEILDEMVTVLIKREFKWGKYDGLAVKVERADGSLAIVEITAKLLIRNLCSTKFPKLPIEGRFVERKSKDGRMYFKFAYMIEEELEF